MIRSCLLTEAELRALQAEITDPNYRLFADGQTITSSTLKLVRGTASRRSSRARGGRPAHASIWQELRRRASRSRSVKRIDRKARWPGAI